jgi:hypothetical protein
MENDIAMQFSLRYKGDFGGYTCIGVISPMGFWNTTSILKRRRAGNAPLRSPKYFGFCVGIK